MGVNEIIANVTLLLVDGRIEGISAQRPAIYVSFQPTIISEERGEGTPRCIDFHPNLILWSEAKEGGGELDVRVLKV
jgi:hypothetical protein